MQCLSGGPLTRTNQKLLLCVNFNRFQVGLNWLWSRLIIYTFWCCSSNQKNLLLFLDNWNLKGLMSGHGNLISPIFDWRGMRIFHTKEWLESFQSLYNTNMNQTGIFFTIGKSARCHFSYIITRFKLRPSLDLFRIHCFKINNIVQSALVAH